ncbi:class I SAM-dependent methyltransferase [Phytoactinopolyspora halotolerans]|uniref:Class I SAM-dependent methyltransferase n=1 Tax=Phytoactinopolyspora halotolerans TaxID=1981512 RepID=A0A6L9S3L9_9ACTN|nr:class I SAM-dependent methyltransferase [Phytoactinopolyspora halotolerans]NED98559.1 class I SAM-dependent methyltransferase [Phytoactinopolyspora halotolerans]
MPTSPEQREQASRPAPDPQPHQARQIAESFGVDVERYDRARPRYPDAMVTRIVAASPGSDVLDVGSGTGIEARQFQAAGCRVLGIEPDARMADFARRGGVQTEVATFEAWETAGRTFDVVISGTAWHWVDPVSGARKAADVLRPGGRIAAFWHVAQPPTDVVAAFATAYRQAAPDAPFTLDAGSNALDGYQALFTTAADGIREAGSFDEPEQWRFDQERVYTREQWLDALPTSGALTRLPADAVTAVLASVGAAVDRRGGSFTVHETVVVVTAVRSGGAPQAGRR